MNVDGLGNGIIGQLNSLSDARAHQRSKAGDSPGRPAQTKLAVPPAPEPVEGEGVPDAETGGAGERGVIRLLEEGHFKGVADVRLRINFYDELSARAAATTAQTATAGTGALIDSVTAKAQELISGWGLGEDAQKAANDLLTEFEAAAEAAMGESTNEGLVDTNRLADALRTAFESFSEELAALAPPRADTVDPATGETLSTTDVAATGDQSTSIPQEPVMTATDTPRSSVSNPDIELLAQFFTDGLVKLLASIGDASQLPPLASQPAGNGKAYEKFVAIYNGLTGQASPAEPAAAPGNEQVDLVV